MFNKGERVREGQAGVSVFVVQEMAQDGRVMVLPAGAAPGAYPFPMPSGSLTRVVD
ncbi:hypothetical protein GCM10027262_75150 [Nocardia tengchongensis]